MSERLRPRDLAILAAESPTTPMHNATVEIFDPGTSGFDHDRLVQLIADRIAFVPRYRQRLQLVLQCDHRRERGRRPWSRPASGRSATPSGTSGSARKRWRTERGQS